MPEITISGFGDEISSDFETQLRCKADMGIHAIVLRGLWDTNIIDLNEDQKQKAKEILERYEFQVSSIGSPVGKCQLDAPPHEEIERFRRAVDMAVFFQSKYIRVFSFYPPEGDPLDIHTDAVLERMRTFVEMAREAGVVMVLENEKGLYGERGDRVAQILNAIDAPELKMAFDPANFVQAGQRPFDECWPLVKEHVIYLHVKDAVLEDGHVVPAGQGDGQFPQLLAALKERGYTGFASLEPHLQVAGHSSGFTGPEKYAMAADILRGLLDQAGFTHG